MWTAIISAIAMLLESISKELVGLAWKRANEPHHARDAPPLPSGLRDRFIDRVRKHKNGIR